jgi:hypothetical protein
LATLKELRLLFQLLVLPLLLQHQLPASHSVGGLIRPWQPLHLAVGRLQLLILCLLDQHRHQQEPRDPLVLHRYPFHLVRRLVLLLLVLLLLPQLASVGVLAAHLFETQGTRKRAKKERMMGFFFFDPSPTHQSIKQRLMENEARAIWNGS